MGIPEENTIELVNATHAELERQYEMLTDRILALSRRLDQSTGILGWQHMAKGFEWDKLKKSAMKLDTNFDSIEHDFEEQEKK